MGWLKEKARSFLRSLYHLQTKMKNGYLQFFDSMKGSWQWVHRRVAEIVTGKPIPPDHEVHHINRKKLDNDPDNLKVLTKEEHRDIHRNERKDKVKKISKKLTTKKQPTKSSLDEISKNFDNTFKNINDILNNMEKIKKAETKRINDLFAIFRSSGNNRGSCPRCGGSGHLQQYNYYCGGVCFLCGGSGNVGYSNFTEYNLDDFFDDLNNPQDNDFHDSYDDYY